MVKKNNDSRKKPNQGIKSIPLITANVTLEFKDFTKLVAAYETLSNAGIKPKFSPRERSIIKTLTLAFIPDKKKPRGRPKETAHPDIAMESFGVANWFFATNGHKRAKAFEQAAQFLTRSDEAIKKHHSTSVSYFKKIDLLYEKNRLIGEGFDPVLSEKEYWEEFLKIHGYRVPM